jgi:GNAT superfamily N-acetyltransferase
MTSTTTTSPRPTTTALTPGSATWPRQPEDTGNGLAVLTVAFAADPLMRWFWPEAGRYAAGFRRIAAQLAAPAVAAGTLDRDTTGDGAAVWLPPGAELPDDVGDELLDSVPAARQAGAAAFLEAMLEAHPAEPHWYLALIGVDPIRQGQGLGSRLLAAGLARCDSAALPAYL